MLEDFEEQQIKLSIINDNKELMMTTETKMPIAIFSSAIFNEKKVFAEYEAKFKNILKEFDPNKYEISIGKLKNKLFIDFVQKLGYEVNIIAQHPKSLENSNKKIIKDHELMLFFIYDKSSIMMKLLIFAQTFSEKIVVPLYYMRSND